METKESTPKVATVLTDAQKDNLPKSVKKNVLMLSEEMRASELKALSPLVDRLIDLKQRSQSLEVDKDEEGNITKESIDIYKTLKSDARTFNGDIGREFKIIKAPYQLISKGLVAIEKGFKTVSDDEVKVEAETKFKEYEDAEAEKSRLAAEKKNKVFVDAANKATEEADVLKRQAKKGNVYNAIRFEMIGEGITDRVIDSIESMNKASLENLKKEITEKTFDSISKHLEIDVLEEDKITELKEKFEKAQKSALTLISDKYIVIQAAYDAQVKLDNDQKAEEEQAKKDREAEVKEWTPNPNISHYTGGSSQPHVPPVPPVPESIPVDIRKSTTSEFIVNVEDKIQALELAVDMRIKDQITEELVILKNKFLKFNS